MKYNLKKRKASASVIVLFMTVIVITLGLSFVCINKTNYKLSDKNKTWLLDYYSIESIMDEDISLIEDYLKSTVVRKDKKENSYLENVDSIYKEVEKDISSSIGISKKDDKLLFNLFLDNKMLNGSEIKSNIGIEVTLIYEINNDIFYIESKKEVPPELQYDSFY